MVVAGAHMEAASRYDNAANLLARCIDSSRLGSLHTAHGRRIVAPLGRSAALSARATRIVARLPGLAPDDGLFAGEMRSIRHAMDENTRLTREIRAAIRENLSYRAELAAAYERIARMA